jgi:NAD(P)-dependent dehydrogenase (short-subunit alcohol dehydrogenase family)
MPTAFITGANRGIGLQTAKGLTVRGYRVILGVRSESAGEKAIRGGDRVARGRRAAGTHGEVREGLGRDWVVKTAGINPAALAISTRLSPSCR